MSDHLDRAAAIVGGCCAHCDDLVDERLALLDEAGLLRRPDDPEVHVEVTTQGSTCVVKVAGRVVFNGVGLEHALLTPSGVKRDAAVAAKALRIVESVCMTTDGDHLDGESEIPVGEVMRMILEAEEAFGIEREAIEGDA